MLINFKIRNYRSFKDEVIFTLEADASKQKPQNVAEVELPNNNNIRLLKTAMIYGANASGKSNIVRAFGNLIIYILEKPNVGEKVRIYNPFLLDTDSKNSNSEIEVNFIGPDKNRYTYKVIYNEHEIEKEELEYFPNGRATNLFSRTNKNEDDKNIHIGVLGSNFGKKEVKIFNNQLLLSKFGSDEPEELLTQVFLYFKNYGLMRSNLVDYDIVKNGVIEGFINNDIDLNKINSLLRFADTKLIRINIDSFPIGHLPYNFRMTPNNKLYGLHSLYQGGIKTGNAQLIPFEDESTGTQILFVLGGAILLTLEKGGILMIDELDMSLHPFLTRMIILMFQSEKLNPKNAQIIFTSHDMTLLDRDLIRRDQVWITEKNENGASEIFSLQDFDGVREETPFDKWYLAGKFGGLPSLKSIDSMFDNDASV